VSSLCPMGGRPRREIRGGDSFAIKPSGPRLQTADGGKQISLWLVAKEMGDRSVARVEDTYGHPSH
jgi:hypothetical protein